MQSDKNEFTEEEKLAFYKALRSRRDVRNGFLNKDISDERLHRVFQAAHFAPSVGYMQPWNFIVIRSNDKKQEVKKAYLEGRALEQEIFTEERKEKYKSLKLEGILEAPVNVLVTCQRDRDGETGLGRSLQPKMDLYSTVCAIQNMWLAARVEGLGMGWVSILKASDLQEIFNLPENVEPVAYLCLGFVEQFEEKPELEKLGWRERLKLDDLIMDETWHD